ncbi:hypothetical protein JHK87_040187 [Glycine soja]|nr:hypothetical protein JHK87_040187 [Glycine soja]
MPLQLGLVLCHLAAMCHFMVMVACWLPSSIYLFCCLAFWREVVVSSCCMYWLSRSTNSVIVFMGDQIHVVCKPDQLKSWKANFKENSTYVMHNFKVVKNDGQFRVCEHQYKLVFIEVTVIREVDLHELPFKKFRFVEFANVVVENFVAGLLFLSYLNERGNDGLMVIILTHARVKDAQGSYPTSMSNSFKASKLLINEPILEIQEFKERLLDLGVEVGPVLPLGDHGSSQVSGGSQLSSKDAFLSKAEVKTDSENNGISEDVVCVTLGTISKIVMDNHSWCYPACIQCHRKIDIQTGPFTCGCGKDNDQPVLRYRVEDGDLDLNVSPQALDRLLGYVLAFKVRIQSKFKNVVVLRYSNELDLINVVLEMLADIDHDPVAGFPLTPKKRIPSDEVDDELGSSQISLSQLSSNKLTRHSDKCEFS